MTTLLRASGSAEFLSIVPSLAGFTPTDSLVLLPFHGTRTCGAMRLDLPDDDVSLDDYVDASIGLVSRVDGTDAVAVVVYTDDEVHDTRDGLVLPLAVEVDELLGRAEEAGLRIVDALCVTPSGWSSYLDRDPEVRRLDEAPPAVPGIGDVSGDQLSGVALPTVDFAEKERVGRALREISDLLEDTRSDALDGRRNPQAIAALVLLEDIPAFFEAVLSPSDDLPPFATAALLWCLDRPLFRDVALTQWATDAVGGARTLAAQLAFADARTAVPDDLGDVFLGRGPSPDPDRLRRALTLARATAARAPLASRPGPLTAAAWLSWALGRASHAAHYLELVREIDPRYGLAAMLDTMINAAVLPEWAFRRGATSTT
ncbi:DUF4192 domain-containing protein [Microbacterium phyllosphaerae]|uniref:DUF4192 domain-containing protein n=1 Tax=Microbacterium phyllosphaerae TaxID=124798 RepID=UPI0021689553|nr:DUF4192 domain-containing protein [Microbacterium phyllosphaerae]MCS3442425.1 hypothetical protein [Microbacterium phyllosphaerae]